MVVVVARRSSGERGGGWGEGRLETEKEGGGTEKERGRGRKLLGDGRVALRVRGVVPVFDAGSFVNNTSRALCSIPRGRGAVHQPAHKYARYRLISCAI